jgi:hypothetical protein
VPGATAGPPHPPPIPNDVAALVLQHNTDVDGFTQDNVVAPVVLPPKVHEHRPDTGIPAVGGAAATRGEARAQE